MKKRIEFRVKEHTFKLYLVYRSVRRVECKNISSLEKLEEGRMRKRIEFKVEEDTLRVYLVYRNS